MGRPTDLTDEVMGRLALCVEKGLPVARACELNGISRQSWYAWKRRGEAGEQPFADFVDSIAAAEAKCQETSLDAIREAAAADPTKGWRGVAWVLERRFPDEWGQTLTIRVQAEVQRELGDFLLELRSELPEDAWEIVKSVAERVARSAGQGGEHPTSTSQHH